MKFVLMGLLLLWNISSSFAVVNYRNGNYFQEFTDLIFPMKAGVNLIFKRSYNSASDFHGILGKGWGTSFETSVSVLPNTVIIKEMGNGKNHIFAPKGSTVDKSLEESFKAIKAKNNLKDDLFAEYKNRLLMDPQALEAELSSVTKNAKASDGEYENVSDPSQKMTVKDQKVDFWDSEGAHWSFDAKGNLNTWTHPSGAKFTVQYDTQGQMISLMSSLVFIQFERTPQNVMKAVRFGSKIAKYEMDKGNLVKSIDQNNETYTYQYEQNKLTKISGKDFAEQVKYSIDSNEVSSVTDSKGKVTNYKFFSQTIPNSLRRAEIRTAGDTPTIYEYEERVGKTGPYLYRRLLQRGHKKQQIIFDDCCGRPLSVLDGELKSEFKYNEKGMPLSLIEADGTTHTWTWNEKGELLKYKNPKDERTYTYDSFGPSLVNSTAMGSMALKRDPTGKIIESTVTSKDGSKKVLRFTHTPDGKSMSLVTEKGQMAFLKETTPGNWDVDKSKTSDLKAKLDWLGWLNKYQDLAKPPYPQQWMPTF